MRRIVGIIVVILTGLLFCFIGGIDIFPYLFFYKKSKGIVIDIEEIEREDSYGVIHIYYLHTIKFFINNEEYIGKLELTKKYKINETITFKYNPEDPPTIQKGIELSSLITFLLGVASIGFSIYLIYQYLDYLSK
ncbi:MAG TPA: hypothetical protein PLE45_04455 [Spirochaetota bacterium]|nr:hypothetical protein [Spirochaetota bacterium]HOL57282.1 hypothetical protein [Spirochaetota bacterium]HPP04832.1 hypothetical protein [Spirochaetota bacterium]